MREMDRLTIQKYGVPSLTLMERAGEGITKAILERFGRAAKKGVLIVAGKGNNGGDGLVVARLLKKKKIPCEVANPGAERTNCRRMPLTILGAYLKLRGKVTEITEGSLDLLSERIRRQGIARGCDSRDRNKKRCSRALCRGDHTHECGGVPIVAVDIPSGLDTDSGTPLGVADSGGDDSCIGLS